MSTQITKLQRWLDLIAYLVGRRMPVPVEELMRHVPAYAEKAGDATSEATARRTFERDKDELRRAGIPIRSVVYTINFGTEQVTGYRLDGRDFYLPYLRLLGDAVPPSADRTKAAVVEVAEADARVAVEALRRVAEMPSFPLAGEARSALRKLSFDLEPLAEPGESVLRLDRVEGAELRDRLRVLTDALVARKRVGFRYHGIHRGEATERDVAPYGLLYQQGYWYLVGHDALRTDVRMFRVARMEAVTANRAQPARPDFEPPADFRLDEYAGREAWELGDERPLRVEVRFRFPLSVWAERNARGTQLRAHDDGSAVRVFDVHQVAPFLRWLLGFGEDAELLGPENLQVELRRLAAEVARRHGGGGDG